MAIAAYLFIAVRMALVMKHLALQMDSSRGDPPYEHHAGGCAGFAGLCSGPGSGGTVWP